VSNPLGDLCPKLGDLCPKVRWGENLGAEDDPSHKQSSAPDLSRGVREAHF